jgi:hypothetical protein
MKRQRVRNKRDYQASEAPRERKRERMLVGDEYWSGDEMVLRPIHR